MSGSGAGRRTSGAGRGMVLATAMTVAVGLFAVPAFGQISGGVGNSGDAGAATGGNAATGNQSTNTAGATATGTNTGLLGGLLGVTINLGAPQNTSSGTATVNSGSAAAAGNNSSGAVNQGSGGGRRGSAGGQSGSVTNSGTADADTGGNSAVGNRSTNVATTTQNVSGGLLGIGINIGGPSNTSAGTATVNTGDATATGNVADGSVTQVGGGHVPFGHAVGLGTGFCGRVAHQVAEVSNQGTASANTGNNEVVGNASTNTATSGGTVSGGLLGVNLSLGGPSNTSDGTAQVNTGAANAVGNESTGTVVQESCVRAAHHLSLPGRAPSFVKIAGHHHHKPTALARTGNAAARLLPFAGLLLALGVLALRVGPVPARRRSRA